jgi:glycosyltransferase involved in cell wall biosynthesis
MSIGQDGEKRQLETQLETQIQASVVDWSLLRERFTFPELPSAGIWRELMHAAVADLTDNAVLHWRSPVGRDRPLRSRFRALGQRVLLTILQPLTRALLARQIRVKEQAVTLAGIAAALELRSAHPDHIGDANWHLVERPTTAAGDSRQNPTRLAGSTPARAEPRSTRRTAAAARAQRRVDQLLPTLSGEDAIGTHVLHTQALLRERGFTSEVFAESWDRALAVRPVAAHRSVIRSGDVTIFHFSIGCWTALQLRQLPSYRVTNYHNITPARYFRERQDYMTNHLVDLGRRQIPMVRSATDFWWVDSSYNSQDIGVEQDAVISPVLRDYAALTRRPSDRRLSRQLASRRTDILFVGRLSPNKGQHDLLLLLALYKKHVDPNVRLMLAGGGGSIGYITQLTDAIRALGLTTNGPGGRRDEGDVDVFFSGPIDETELATFYRRAQLFLCLSEHEGFCVPLVEAMSFGIPVIANRAAAVPETCGGAALMVDKRDPATVLAAMRGVLGNGDLVERLRQGGLARAKAFEWERLAAGFDSVLEATLRRAGEAKG